MQHRQLLLCALAALSPFSTAQTQHPGTVPLTPAGGDFDNTKGNLVRLEVGHLSPLQLDPTGQFLIAPNNAGNRMAILHWPTRTLIAEIPTGCGIASIVQHPSTGEIWAVDSVTHSVSVIDPIQQAVKATIPVGKEPHGIAILPDGSRAYVTNSASNTVSVIQCSTLSVTATVGIPAMAPRGIAVHDGHVYVSAFFSGNNTAAFGIPNLPSDPLQTFPGGPNETLGTQEVVKLPATAGAIPLPDEDLFAINPSTNTLVPARTRTGIGTILLNLHSRPGTAELWIPHTEALNATHKGKLNFIGGKFVQNRIAVVNTQIGTLTFIDLDAAAASLGIGFAQPSAIAFDTSRNLAYVAAFGSDTIAVIDLASKAVNGWYGVDALTPNMPVAPFTGARCGPRGLSMAGNNHLLVFNKLDNSFTAIDLVSTPLNSTLPLTATGSLGYDPTPHSIKRGLGSLANADLSLGKTSSCFSCHVDGHLDQLVWELSDFKDPAGTISPRFEEDHKGPMVTQSLRGLFEAGPYHWRGEMGTLDKFNAAFVKLFKLPAALPQAQYDELKEGLRSLVYPSNPRQLQRPHPVKYSSDATATRGREAFGNRCASCHALPLGSNGAVQRLGFSLPSPTSKVAPLRGVADKLHPDSLPVFPGANHPNRTRNGMGLTHGGAVGSLLEFVNLPIFAPMPASEAADLVSFLSSFDSGLAPSTAYQATVSSANPGSFGSVYDTLLAQIQAGDCDGMIATSMPIAGGGYQIGTLAFDRVSGTWLSQTPGISLTRPQIQALVTTNGRPLTFYGLPLGMGWRTAVDRDGDWLRDGGELGMSCSWTNPDTDRDGIPDGLDNAPANPSIGTTDTQPPVLTQGVRVVYATVNTVKLELSTNEPTRVEVRINGAPAPDAPVSPTTGGWDINHSLVVPLLRGGSTTVLVLRIADVAGNRIQIPINATTASGSEYGFAQSITQQGYAASVLTVGIQLAADTLSGGTAPLMGSTTIEVFAFTESATGALTNIWQSQLFTSTNGNHSVPVPVNLPAGAGHKLHIGVRDAKIMKPGQTTFQIGYMEAFDTQSFATLPF